MADLISKSNKSLQSATILLSNKQYCSSVQCSYFSCLQNAKAMVLAKISNPKDFEKKLKDAKSHTEIIKAARILVSNSKSAGKFADTMSKLKRWRLNAIYYTHDMKEVDAIEAIDMVSRVQYILNN